MLALVVGRFLWARVRHGSWTGALFKGSIEMTHGEVELLPTYSRNEVLRVIALRNEDGESLVGLVVSDNAPLAASVIPYRDLQYLDLPLRIFAFPHCLHL